MCIISLYLAVWAGQGISGKLTLPGQTPWREKKTPQIQSGGNHLPSNYQLTTSAQKPREDEDARGASNTSPNTQIFSCCFSLNLRKSPCVSPWMCRCSIRASEEASRSSLFNNLQQRQFHRRHYGGRRRADRRAFTDPETKSNTWKDTGDMPDFHVLNVYTDMVVLIYHNTFIRSHTQNEPLAFIRNKLQRTAFFFLQKMPKAQKKKNKKQNSCAVCHILILLALHNFDPSVWELYVCALFR